MKRNFLFKIIAMIVVFASFWTQTCIAADLGKGEPTILELKRQFPRAEIKAVTLEEIENLAKQYGSNCTFMRRICEGTWKIIDITEVTPMIASSKGPPNIQKINNNDEELNLNQVTMSFPDIDFYVENLTSPQIKKNFFDNAFVLISKTIDCPKSFSTFSSIKIEALQKNYPQIKFAGITWEMYESLRKESNNDCVVLGRASYQKGYIKSSKQGNDNHDRSENKGTSSFQPSGSCIGDFGNLDFGNNDAAAVLYVLIGVVLVAVLIVYVVQYGYNVVYRGAEVNYWIDVASHYTAIQTDSDGHGVERGSLSGMRISSGIADHFFNVGLTAEIGYLDMKLDFEETHINKQIHGVYGMIGPVIRLQFEEPYKPYILLELIAGASNHDDVGLISAARIGANFGIGSRIRLGFYIGSLYFDLKETDGLIKNYDDYKFLFGLEMGYRF
ncbi:MAG: hypothetical protein HQK76_01870 [Desulfobacterales bacterium]|nr:hypothetical protein [Desulfobacterales bacterium]